MRKGTLRRSLRRRGRRFLARLLAAAGTVIIIVIFFAAARFRRMAVELALSSASDIITTEINGAVSRLCADGTIDRAGLVTFEKDAEGNITALSTNMAGINLLQAAITNAVIERFAASDIMTVSVPTGSVIGGALFSGRGPRIDVKLLSVTNVNTSFRNEFTSAGINQTRHRVFMDVEVTYGVVLAGCEDWETIVTEVGVAETVIVGSVPEMYAAVN